jgi:sugar/nucleoside kinase (ribokinase family)
MSDARYDVLGIGNAIVDVIATADDDFLRQQQVAKGSMTLIDEARAESLFRAMGPATITSGGSAGNTVAGLASLGARAAYIGKLRDDEAGRLFRHDIAALGIAFDTAPALDGPASARSFILVTPDGERTMNTYLGACQGLGPDDIDAATVEAASITYLEGYLWDPPAAKDAFRKASDIAHAAGRKVALTLSDSFCVDRYRAEFLALMRAGALDIVFANEHELRSLYETADFDAALAAIRNDVPLAVLTRSEKGALAVSREETVAVPAFPVETVVDTTGAGDLFAAGFLHGLTRGLRNRDSLALGAFAAAEVIQKIGPRPERSLKEAASGAGLTV